MITQLKITSILVQEKCLSHCIKIEGSLNQ